MTDDRHRRLAVGDGNSVVAGARSFEATAPRDRPDVVFFLPVT